MLPSIPGWLCCGWVDSMRRDAVVDPFADLLRIPPEHEAIDAELLNWATWARSGRGHAAMSPMFRMFRSNFARGEYGVPTAAPTVDTSSALDTERAIRRMPETHRGVLRGWYVYRLAPWTLCRRLGLHSCALQQTLHDARTMARNIMAA